MKIRDLKYLLAYLIPFSAFLALELRSVWSFSTVILAFLIIPVFELIFKPNPNLISSELQRDKSANVFFESILYLNIPILFILIFRTFTIIQLDITNIETLGLFMNVGIVMATTGINVAHEIGHRKGKLNKICAALLLIPSLYGHFTLEHNYGHHKWVATPEDPVSAELNQNLYAFIYSAVIGVFKNSWRISFRMQEKKGLSLWHFSNELIWISLAQIFLFSLIFYFGNFFSLIFFIGAAIFSFSLLESIDYIEHYGLRRKLLSSGKYEIVNEKHSWNSEHEIGRIFLYELTRHTDHHISSIRKYQNLRNLRNSPQLPFGYPSAILVALLPPLWFSIMNPLVKSYNN